jgi:hypothetical protein
VAVWRAICRSAGAGDLSCRSAFNDVDRQHRQCQAAHRGLFVCGVHVAAGFPHCKDGAGGQRPRQASTDVVTAASATPRAVSVTRAAREDSIQPCTVLYPQP